MFDVMPQAISFHCYEACFAGFYVRLHGLRLRYIFVLHSGKDASMVLLRQ